MTAWNLAAPGMITAESSGMWTLTRSPRPRPSTLEVRIVSHFEAPGLRTAWRKLSTISPTAGMFTSYDWCRCAYASVLGYVQPHLLQVIDARGETVGLLPLCIERAGGARWLKFLGADRVAGDQLDVLYMPGFAEAVVAATVAYLERARRAYDGIVLNALRPSSPLRDALIGWAADHAHPWQERSPQIVPYIDLPARFDTYLASRPSRREEQVRRARKRLALMPEAGLAMTREPEQVESVLETFLDLHRRGEHKLGTPGTPDEQALSRFLRRFAAVTARHGGLRCQCLSLRGRAHAVLLVFHWRRTAYAYPIAQLAESVIDRPGDLLIAASIEQAIAEGMTRYDFLRGDDAYKFDWTDRWSSQTSLIIGCHAAAKAALAAQRVKVRIASTLERCLGPTGWERARRFFRE